MPVKSPAPHQPSFVREFSPLNDNWWMLTGNSLKTLEFRENKKFFQNSCFIFVERQLNIRPVLYSIETLSKKIGFATMMMMSFCAQATCPLKCKLPLSVKGHNFSTSEDALVQSSKGHTEENPSWNLTDYSLWALILINPTFRETGNQNFSNWLSHKNWEEKEGGTRIRSTTKAQTEICLER